MTIAEIRGKISSAGTNLSEKMEDLLTADVLGCMRYVPAHKVLVPFLRTAKSFRGNILTVPERIVKVHYSFWPWIKLKNRNPCEPDVVLGLETEDGLMHIVLIEAKYYSGLSSEEDEYAAPNDQLARELDNLDAIACATLGWKLDLHISSRTLLFVTPDMGIPRDLLAQSLSEYKRKRHIEGDIFWASWRFLPYILERNLEKETVPEHAAVLEDMLKLLLRKELLMFGGVEPITEFFELPLFYHLVPSKYSWPDIPEPLDINYAYKGGR